MKCRGCNTELTHIKEADCLRCLVCKPIAKESVVEQTKEKNYVDVPWTEERIKTLVEEMIREIVQDEIENWHIRPPVDRIPPREPDNPPEKLDIVEGLKDWRVTAKELGIKMYQRKKTEVLADIAEKTKRPDEGQ